MSLDERATVEAPVPNVMASDSPALTPRSSAILTVFLAGFPLWWLAGLGLFGFMLVGLVLGYQLLRLRRIHIPAGFGIWLLFLVVVIIGVTALWIPVPGLLPEAGASRILSWAYRLTWLISTTCVMLYIGNTSERVLPTRRLVLLFAWLFALTVLGGYAGNFAYGIDFPSVLEIVLPGAIAHHPFVSTLIHPGLAQVQDILGYESPRPKAPFEYANSWGANYGMLLPYFVLAITFTKKRWHRIALSVFLILALPPAIFSLNRGMWLGLGALVVMLIVRMALTGKVGYVLSFIGGLVVAAFIVVASPLWNLVTSRIENPHSNTGRSNLATFTVQTTLEHSPIIGFGSTRTRQGNFFSIAAGATADCHQCSPPQLGTQGTLWFLIFCTGFLGTALFIAFFVRRYAPLVTDTRIVPFTTLASAVYFACVLPVYDTVSSPLFILMAGTGLAWRYERAAQVASHNGMVEP